jgi:RNA-directed DNA polymerase
LDKLRVEINEDKSRMVDLSKGEMFSLLGFEFRRILSRNQKWRPYCAPKLKKRTALFAKLREIFRRYASQTTGRVIEKINPILRGWVNYFAVGHSSRCFSMVKDLVEKKIRRHGMRARKRKGFGWKRWSSEWLYGTLRGRIPLWPRVLCKTEQSKISLTSTRRPHGRSAFAFFT